MSLAQNYPVTTIAEIGTGCNLLRSYYPNAKIEITPDLSGMDRVVSVILRTAAATESELAHITHH